MHPLPGNSVKPGEFGDGEPFALAGGGDDLGENAEGVVVEVEQEIEEPGEIGRAVFRRERFRLLLFLTGDVLVIGEVGGPFRDAVELLPAEGAVHAGFGFGAEAAGGREFAQPPSLIEFSPALRRLFHTENPLDFQYSAVSGTINRRYGLFCKKLAF